MSKSKKRRMIIMAGLVMSVAGLTVPAAVLTACHHEEPPAVADVSGMYYDSAKDCFVELNGSTMKYNMTVGGTDKSGDYAYDGTNLTLYVGNDIVYGTLNSDTKVLTLSYNEVTYTLGEASGKLTFDVGSGVTAVKAQVITVGGKATRPANNPTKNNYVFAGWYTDATYKTAFDFDAPIQGKMTAYARFEQFDAQAKNYTVSFDVAGGTTAIADVTTVNGKVYELPTPKKAGSTFVGWWVSDYEDGEKLTYKYDERTLTSDTTFFAVWEKNGDVNVSVDKNGVSWTSQGVNRSYSVVIVDPQGTPSSPRTVSANSYAYNFDAQLAGDYEVRVTYQGKTSVAYFKNKAIARVNLNDDCINGSKLSFDEVAHAEKYLITVECGDEFHNHVQVDIGTETEFDFSDCVIPGEGIKFTVEAVAEDGYASSVASSYTLKRALAQVTNLTADASSGVLSWNAVDGAERYIVKITAGGNTETKVVVGTSLSLTDYTGALSFEVQPAASGYASPAAATASCTINKLARPANVRVEGNTLKWTADGNASGYKVNIDGTDYDAATAEYDLSGISGTVEVKVCAVGASAANNSFYSDIIKVSSTAAIGEVGYANGVADWNAVLNATEYGITVNDGEEVKVGACSAEITFTKAGANTITIKAYNEAGNVLATGSKTVTAYTVNFDVAGGEGIAPVYKAFGDEVVAPETAEKHGYNFVGWYTKAANGRPYQTTICPEDDMTVYAYFDGKEFTVTLDAGEGTVGAQTVTVKYGESYKLPVAVSEDGAFVFGGWYSEPNNKYSICFADASGDGIWTRTDDVTVHALYIEAFRFTLQSDGTYAVSQATHLKYASNVTVPAYFNDKLVSIVDGGCFANCKNLVEVHIPNTVRLIVFDQDGGNGAASAFRGCTALQNVYIYEVEGNHRVYYSDVNGVLIYNNEFNGVELKYYPMGRKSKVYTVPDIVETLPINIFQGTRLESVYIPASVTKIDDKAFANCSFLKSITFNDPLPGETVQPLTLGNNLFEKCEVLKEINLPTRIADLDVNCFNSCKTLEAVNVIGEGGANYASIDGMLTNAAKTEIIYCPKGYAGPNDDGEYRVQAGVSKIGANAFAGCEKIKKLVIPGYVTYIGENAFANCQIEELVWEANAAQATQALELTIARKAFYHFTTAAKMPTIVLPNNLVSLGEMAFGGVFFNSGDAEAKVVVNCTSSKLQIANGAFANEDGGDSYLHCYVKNVEIGKDVVELDINAVFGGNSNHSNSSLTNRLESVTVDAQNPNYNVDNDSGAIYNKNYTKLLYLPTNVSAITIPSTVSKIGVGMFAGRTAITSIVIPNTVTAIEASAFSGCTGLTSITFADREGAPLTIAMRAFEGCTNISSITLPEGLTHIGEMAFAYCTNLQSVSLPATLTDIANLRNVFTNCNKLANIEVASGNTKYASVSTDGALYGKHNGVVDELLFVPVAMTVGEGNDGTFVLPSTVTSVGYWAFNGNKNLVSFTYEGGTPAVGLTFGERAFVNCSNLSDISLPSDLKTISELAFSGTGIASIEIPNSVTKICSQAFSNCFSLTSITFASGNETEALEIEDGSGNNGAFSSTKITTLTLPERTTKVGAYAFYNTSLQTVNLPSTLTVIGDGAFSYNKSLTAVNFTEGTAGLSIGNSAFYGCDNTGFNSITLPANLVSIGTSAFRGCVFTSISFPASLTSIGQSAFDGCASLTQVTFADNSQLVYILDYAFRNTSLQTINLEKCTSLQLIGREAFKGCKFTSIIIPASVITIGSYSDSGAQGNSFENCTALTSVTFAGGNWLTSEGEETTEGGISKLSKVRSGAFKGCTSLTEFTFPESEYSIELGASLFDGCTALKRVNLSKSIAALGDSLVGTTLELIKVQTGSQNFVEYEGMPMLMDGNMTSIKAIYGELDPDDGVLELPEGLVSIGDYSFKDQKKLTKVVLPSTLVSIGREAFMGCTNLAEIDTSRCRVLRTVGSYAFAESGITSMTLPDTVELELEPVDINEFKVYSHNYNQDIYDENVQARKVHHLFYNCASLETVKLGKGINYVGDSWFEGCTSLRSIDLSYIVQIGDSLLSSGTSASAYKLYLYYENTRYSHVAKSFYGCENLEEVTFSKTLRLIGAYSFYGCTKLKTVNLPDTVFGIGMGAFEGSGLTEFTAPKALKGFAAVIAYDGMPVTSVENNKCTGYADTFKNCKSLTTVTLHDEFYAICHGAFSGCTNLTTINNADSVVYLGMDSNVNMQAGAYPAITNKFTLSKGGSMFANTKLTEISLHSIGNTIVNGGVTLKGSISEAAFKNCTKLENVELNTAPSSYVLPVDIFYGCTALESVDLRGAKEFDYNDDLMGRQFYNCTSLTTVKMPDEMPNAGEWTCSLAAYMFYHCTALTSITIPEGIKIIDFNCFEGCVKLESVSLPDSMTDYNDSQGWEAAGDIDSEAFSGCTSLTSVYFNNVATVAYDAFDGCTALTTVTKAATNTALTTVRINGKNVTVVVKS